MKKILQILSFAALIIGVGCSDCGAATTTREITIEPTAEDVTYQLRQAIESVGECDELTIKLSDGIYKFSPDLAFEKYAPITNHGNGVKRIAFPLSGYKKITIEGNGAELLFHGQMMPFLFEGCDNVEVRDLTIDWDTPFTFLAEVIETNAKEGWRVVRPRTAKDGFSWMLKGGKIQYPNIDGFNYAYLGSTLAFDPETKRPVVGILDLHSEPTKVEQLKSGDLKIYEKLRQMPPVGSLLSSKGDREHDRYAPAFDFKECSNIHLEGITIHHALGMGFLFERSEDITIKESQIVLAEGSKRVIASTADASHFANCRGEILIEGCRFENMLDDGTNVHGTYVEVTEVVDPTTVRVAFQHFEQMGFNFAEADDEMWFILCPSPERAATGVVKSVNRVNETITEITFTEPLPAALGVGDVLENKTWNPTFTMRGCTIQNHRARSVVLKTPLKTVIENNYFSSMMSGVLFRGEMKNWYESGAVEDVLIQNNTFENSADCGTLHAALYITPLFNPNFDSTALYDRNIRFVGNTIRNANPRIVIADRVEGLLIEGNTIERTTEYTAPFPDAPMFELINSKDVTIKGNSYKGAKPNVMVVDDVSQKSLKIKGNRGF
ncbi:MAG: right-handed parallel beta-helix repeat-containing protein [Rikenellaceae bacterium]